MNTRTAIWTMCDDCDDFWCTIHKEHVADCECPTLEEWLDNGKDPYTDTRADLQ
jgi:hypothetical protein